MEKIKKIKAQGSFEFMMTYGWAILIIIGIALYIIFSQIKPNTILPESCNLIPGLNCQDNLVTTNNIALVLSNRMTDNLTITNFTIETCSSITNFNISTGKRLILIFENCTDDNIGNKIYRKMSVNYKTINNIEHQAFGSLVAIVEKLSQGQGIGVTINVNYNDGIWNDSYDLYDNNDARVIFPSSVIPVVNPINVTFCFWISDDTSAQETGAFKFKVNDNTIYSIPDSQIEDNNHTKKYCKEIYPIDYSDHYNLVMWYEPRELTSRISIALDNSQPNSKSYYDNTTSNAPGDSENSIPWIYLPNLSPIYADQDFMVELVITY